ncbi:MAG: hypothetical protein V4489_09020 [Chlamydiota bacterium]
MENNNSSFRNNISPLQGGDGGPKNYVDISLHADPSNTIDYKTFRYRLPPITQDQIDATNKKIYKLISSDSNLTELARLATRVTLVSLQSGAGLIFEYTDGNGKVKEVCQDISPELKDKDKDYEGVLDYLREKTRLEKGLLELSKCAQAKKGNPTTSNKSEFRSNYVFHQRWSRLYNQVLKLEKDGVVPPSSLAELKFFAIQYLAKVASYKEEEAKGWELASTPLQDQLNYFRSHVVNIPLRVLDQSLAHMLDVEPDRICTVSNASRVIEVLQQEQKEVGSIIIINDGDADGIVREKIQKAHDLSGVAILKFLKSSPEKLKNQIERVTGTIAEIGNIKCEVLLAGDIAEHHFFLNIPETDQKTHIMLDEIRWSSPYFGYTPTLQNSLRIISREVTLSELPQLASITPLDDSDSRLGLLFVNDFTEFLSSATFLSFMKFADDIQTSQGTALLAINISLFIQGFQDSALDRSFAEKGLSLFLKESYARVLNLMEIMMATDDKEDVMCDIRVANFKDLIFEDLFFWVNCLETQKETSLSLTDKTNQILYEKVLPGVHLRPASCGVVGSGSLTATMIQKVCTACMAPESKLNVLVFQDVYYGVVASVSKFGNNATTITSSPTYEDCFKNKLEELQEGQLDLVFVDPHGSFSVNERFVTAHDIDSLIGLTLERGAAREPMTIVLDLTIGRINDKKITDLLNKYEDKITSGRLNIICYRSIQKFDSFGTDKISGGYYQVYTSVSKFIEAFERIGTKEGRDVDPINKKCLTHFYENCTIGLDSYREVIFANTQYVYERIDKNFIDSNPNRLRLVVEERRDDENYFIILNYKCPVSGLPKFIDSFIQRLKYNNFACCQRYSFGYSHTTLTDIDNYIRISFGLEGKEKLDIFVGQLNEILALYNENLDSNDQKEPDLLPSIQIE